MGLRAFCFLASQVALLVFGTSFVHADEYDDLPSTEGDFPERDAPEGSESWYYEVGDTHTTYNVQNPDGSVTPVRVPGAPTPQTPSIADQLSGFDGPWGTPCYMAPEQAVPQCPTQADLERELLDHYMGTQPPPLSNLHTDEALQELYPGSSPEQHDEALRDEFPEPDDGCVGDPDENSTWEERLYDRLRGPGPDASAPNPHRGPDLPGPRLPGSGGGPRIPCVAGMICPGAGDAAFEDLIGDPILAPAHDWLSDNVPVYDRAAEQLADQFWGCYEVVDTLTDGGVTHVCDWWEFVSDEYLDQLPGMESDEPSMF